MSKHLNSQQALVARQVSDAAKLRAKRKRIALEVALDQCARERGYPDWEPLRLALVAERTDNAGNPYDLNEVAKITRGSRES